MKCPRCGSQNLDGSTRCAAGGSTTASPGPDQLTAAQQKVVT